MRTSDSSPAVVRTAHPTRCRLCEKGSDLNRPCNTLLGQRFFVVLRGISGKCRLTPDWQFCVSVNGLAWPINACAERLGCAPHGRHTFLACPRKVCQRRAPGIRVSLRSTSLAPVPLRGPAYKGRPWPFKPLAASMRLVPLRNTSTRPPDGTGSRACEISVDHARRRLFFAFALKLRSHRRRPNPLQEAEWNRCVSGVPLER